MCKKQRTSFMFTNYQSLRTWKVYPLTYLTSPFGFQREQEMVFIGLAVLELQQKFTLKIIVEYLTMWLMLFEMMLFSAV